MEVGRKDKFYKVKWFWNIMRHGLFLHGVRNQLAKIGIDIMPYYWVQEATEPITPPNIRGDASGFKVSYFGEEEIKEVKSTIIGIEGKDLLDDLKNGQLCIGIKHNENIAAYMFIKRENFTFRKKTFELKENESYMHSMYTFESYRGKNLAPFLRYNCYELAKEKGINVNYSVTEYFNKSTIKFKKKLNSKPVKLLVSIVLFKKYTKNITLKNY
jgi:hypothetical protein